MRENRDQCRIQPDALGQTKRHVAYTAHRCLNPGISLKKQKRLNHRESELADSKKSNVTRRTLLKAGAAIPLLGVAAPAVLAQAPSKSPTKVLDFMTNADVAKAEQEGQLVFYCHENEAGTAGIMEGFQQGFPEDQDQLCARADRRALQQDPVRTLRPAVSTSTSSSSPTWRRPSISRKRAATNTTFRPRLRPTRPTI